MKRWLFNFVAVVSLLLCVATVIDRVVQHWYFHWVELNTWKWNGPEQVVHGMSITGRSGILVFSAYATGHKTGTGQLIERHVEYGMERVEPNFKLSSTSLLARFGFACEVEHFQSNPNWVEARSLVLPTWFCALMLAILPAHLLRRRREMARRRIAGHCLNCGYDLRATPDRCPECGTIPTARAAAPINPLRC